MPFTFFFITKYAEFLLFWRSEKDKTESRCYFVLTVANY